ncbi:MAG: hypothetical protein HPY59_14270 [Anaerolineae bacterium]|nr:hypothetical protein [Anaerolineae bacterium]
MKTERVESAIKTGRRPQLWFAIAATFRRMVLLVLTLFLSALACNLPVENLETITPQVSPLPMSTGQVTPAMTLTKTDACKLLDEAEASALLAEAVIPPEPINAPGYSTCTYFTGTGKGIYISISLGDQAKKNLLNEIAQYQKGCSISYSGGTNTATPFPPEVEALMSKSVLELLQMDIQMQGNCGRKVEPIPEFGPHAYAYLTPTALQIGTVVIVSGDNIYSFSYADPKLDIAQMVEKAKEVTRAVLSLDQKSGATPVNNSTQVGAPTTASSLTPISSPTWVGPTPVSNPTWVGPTPIIPKPDNAPTPIGGGNPTPTLVQ